MALPSARSGEWTPQTQTKLRRLIGTVVGGARAYVRPGLTDRSRAE
ncbi:hypothetical protein [Nonomuraea soli]|uniref:Uncharacterized protein n=1 Tax=Nonomuraea soli TaxID=1032476 RepID=A0A7W0HWL6_9ACTN|nr:hypothetical protein [Nonomuraea soli]MBA2897986.1 hypothetical protein [Nonomuraea soli]